MFVAFVIDISKLFSHFAEIIPNENQITLVLKNVGL